MSRQKQGYTPFFQSSIRISKRTTFLFRGEFWIICNTAFSLWSLRSVKILSPSTHGLKDCLFCIWILIVRSYAVFFFSITENKKVVLRWHMKVQSSHSNFSELYIVVLQFRQSSDYFLFIQMYFLLLFYVVSSRISAYFVLI